MESRMKFRIETRMESRMKYRIETRMKSRMNYLYMYMYLGSRIKIIYVNLAIAGRPLCQYGICRPVFFLETFNATRCYVVKLFWDHPMTFSL